LESYLNNCFKIPEIVLMEVSWFTFNNQRTHFHRIAGDLFVKDPWLWSNYFDYDKGLLMDIKKVFKESLNLYLNPQVSKNKISYANRFK
jgi:hypothetical protein